MPDEQSKMANLALIVSVNTVLADFPGIVVTSSQGRALGFGCGLVVQSDLAIAADTAEFGFDEILHGRAPSFVMSYLESYVGAKRALDLVVTGRTLGAQDALEYGMVSRVVPADLLTGATADLVSSLTRTPAELLQRCKRYTREIRAVPQADRLQHALGTFAGR